MFKFSSSRDSAEPFLQILVLEVEKPIHAPLLVLGFFSLGFLGPHERSLIWIRHSAVGCDHFTTSISAPLAIISAKLRWQQALKLLPVRHHLTSCNHLRSLTHQEGVAIWRRADRPWSHICILLVSVLVTLKLLRIIAHAEALVVLPGAIGVPGHLLSATSFGMDSTCSWLRRWAFSLSYLTKSSLGSVPFRWQLLVLSGFTGLYLSIILMLRVYCIRWYSGWAHFKLMTAVGENGRFDCKSFSNVCAWRLLAQNASLIIDNLLGWAPPGATRWLSCWISVIKHTNVTKRRCFTIVLLSYAYFTNVFVHIQVWSRGRFTISFKLHVHVSLNCYKSESHIETNWNLPDQHHLQREVDCGSRNFQSRCWGLMS